MTKAMEELQRVLDEAKDGAVSTRRQLMVMRARLDTAEREVARMKDGLDELDGHWNHIIAKARETARISRETVALCDAFLDAAE